MMFRNGFTLIELMIVIVIIGILAAMAIPNFTNMQDHAKEASTISNAHTLQLAVEDYSVRNNGIYSVAAGDIVPLLPGAGLLGNVFTGAPTNPLFGGPAAVPGQIGLEGVIVGGIQSGYVITASGNEGNILTLTAGQ